MNGLQKVIKIFAICLAIFIIVNIFSAIVFGLSILINIFDNGEKNISGATFSESYKDITKIDIDVSTANVEIKAGTEFKVEASDIESEFSSKLDGKTLKIKEEEKWTWNKKTAGEIVIYIPNELVLEKLNLNTGAGNIFISETLVDDFEIDHGVGVLEISNSNFDKVDIDGGAGEIKITDSKLNDMDLDSGVGKVSIESEITGKSDIQCGVGELEILLKGSKESYTITAEKGIGSIKINNEEMSNNSTYGDGENKINLEGGIGSISVKFNEVI